MDLRDTQKPRGWPWRTKKNSFGEGGISPPTVKLFDEQEVARILEDQFRIQKEELDCTLREVDEKYGEKEKATNEKLNKALAEIAVKDNLVKQHIKVAEEAVIGWERAENEAAEFKLQLECALQQRLSSEGRVEHLDGALEEAMKQLRSAREEQDQRVHEAIAKKTQEYDNLRLEMESKLAEVWHVVGQTRAELIDARAENKALSHALQDRSKSLAEGKNDVAGSETEMTALQMRLEEVVKENMALKYDTRLITKELEVRMTELELERKASDMASKQHAEIVKKIAKLDEECDRLRMLLRKKLLNSAALVRVKQDVGGSGKDHPTKGSPRRRPLGRSQSATDPQEVISHETLQAILEANAPVDKILNLEKETRMLKEALAKRNDELQNARFMCAKTASRLSSVEEEVQALRAPSKPASSKKWPSNDLIPRRGTSLNFELMDDFEEMERLANSQSQSLPASSSERVVETALTVFGAVDESSNQLRIVGLEETLTLRDRELEVASLMCQELGNKLSVAEEKLAFLQSRNSANEQVVRASQTKLDSLPESRAISEGNNAFSDNGETAMALRKLVHTTEALAQAAGIESTPITSDHLAATNASGNFFLLSMRWHDERVDSSMSSLLQATHGYLESGVDVLKLLLELTATLDCILTLRISANEKEKKERDSSAGDRLAITMELESARVTISQLEEELCRLRVEHSDMEPKFQVEVGHNLEAEVTQMRTEKNELESNLSEVDEQLVEANVRVTTLRVRLSESENLVKELQALQAAHDNEDEEEKTSPQETMEHSSPGRCLSASPRAANSEMDQLRDKVARLEIELQRERCRHQEVVAKQEVIQELTQREVERTEHSSGRSTELENSLQPAPAGDDAFKCAGKENETTSFALGLHDPHHNLPVPIPDSPDSTERTTQKSEFCRSQAEEAGSATAPPVHPVTSLTWASRSTHSTLPGLFHRQANHRLESWKNGTNLAMDWPLLLNDASQLSSSGGELGSNTTSPRRVLRSVRTIRGSASGLRSANDSPKGDGTSMDSRSTTTSTTFSRFYSRSHSETSMSSDHSIPGPP